MKLTPSSIARRNTAFASSRSAGGPQMPSPVIRMAPKPRRLTVRSPPTSIVPAFPAWIVWNSDMDHDSFDLRLRYRCHDMSPIGLVAGLFEKGYAGQDGACVVCSRLG